MVDFGFTNPIAAQWWHVDPNGRMIMTREIYETGMLVEDLAGLIKEINEEHNEWLSAIVCDHDAEDRATLERHLGMQTLPALKGQGSVIAGIGMVKARLRVAADGRPKILFAQNASNENGLEFKVNEKTDMHRVRVWPLCVENNPGRRYTG